MSMTRLLGQQERGARESESKERAREAGPPRREEGWAPEEGQRVLEGLGLGLAEGLRKQEYIGALSVYCRQ